MIGPHLLISLAHSVWFFVQARSLVCSCLILAAGCLFRSQELCKLLRCSLLRPRAIRLDQWLSRADVDLRHSHSQALALWI